MILKESKPPQQIEQNYALNRLINYTKSAEGPILPNRMQGGNERVYTVTNLQVAKVERVGANTNFTLTWSEPSQPQADQLSFYQVFIFDQNLGITQPLATTLVRSSPAVVSIAAPEGSVFTFLVQTMLMNGQVSDIASSPTCTGRSLDTANNTNNLLTPATIDTTGPFTAYSREMAGNTIGSGQNFQARFQGTYTTIGGANTFNLITQIYNVVGTTAYLNQSIAAPTGIVTNAPITVDWWGVFYENGTAGILRSFTTATLNTTTSTVFSTSNTTSVNTTQPIQFNLGVEWTNFTAGCTLTLALANLTFY